MGANSSLRVEQARKALCYVRRWDSYWRESSGPSSDGALEPYPLDFRPRIHQGHYPAFDEAGLPLWPNRQGRLAPLTTAITSYALGSWHLYLDGDSDRLSTVLAAADWLLDGPRVGGELHLLDADFGTGLSAMSQGEAMSVLCRAWQATSREKYRRGALACLGPFRRAVEESGVRGKFESDETIWYEELTSAPRHHILNGMVYALWGLQDLATLCCSDEASEHYRVGVAAVVAKCGAFDLGWWSRYWVPEEGGIEYIASAMYHNLHVCQLQALGRSAHEPKIEETAERFRRQTMSPVHRARALMNLLSGKQRLRRLRREQQQELFSSS